MEDEKLSERISYNELKKNIAKVNLKPNFNKKWYEENYKNRNSRIPMLCSCGNDVNLTAFSITKQPQKKKGCNDCTNKLKAGLGKNSYEEVVEKIKSLSCKPDFAKKWFKENYQGVRSPLPLVCKCKNPFERTYQSFIKHPLCDDCRIENKKNKLLDFETVVERVKETGCLPQFDKAWFEDNYNGNDCLLPLLCTCKKPFLKAIKSVGGNNIIKCDDCRDQKVTYTAMVKKYQRVLEIAQINQAIPSFDLDWFSENYQDKETVLPFICRCGKKTTLMYKAITVDHMVCKPCKKAQDHEERLLNSMGVETNGFPI
jgi:hypothetical protein